MHMDVVPMLPFELLDDAWYFYRDAFDELRTRAVMRHVLYRHEFEAQMLDKRVDKYVVMDGATVVGLAAVTDDLEAVPGISPDYFAHRWPDHYAERRIFYVEFIAARPGRRGVGVYVRLVRSMLERITAADGIAVADICSHNETQYGLPDMLGLAARRVTGAVRQERLDTQSYWLYEFPAGNGALPAAG
jgi:hypothetical protein